MSQNIQPGDKITVPGRVPGIRHWGIYTERGTVVHASYDHGTTVETSYEVFAGGRHISARIEQRAGWDYGRIIARARSKLGTPYSLSFWNCEHLANYATHAEAQSPTAVLFAVGTVFTLALGGAALASSGYDSGVGRYRDSNGRFTRGWW